MRRTVTADEGAQKETKLAPREEVIFVLRASVENSAAICNDFRLSPSLFATSADAGAQRQQPEHHQLERSARMRVFTF